MLLCADQGFSNFFAHVPLSIKRIISRHLIYAGVIVQLLNNITVFSFQLTKSFEPERKFLDVGARSAAKRF